MQGIEKSYPGVRALLGVNLDVRAGEVVALSIGWPRVSVEAGSDQGWWKYVGAQGACVSVGHFGASASADELFAQLGFTADNVASVARTVLNRTR